MMFRRLAIVIILASVFASKVEGNILVVGSINADTFLPVSRLPTEGENVMLVPGKEATVDVPGGKGCTQAVAASKLCLDTRRTVSFAGQFGNDEAAAILRQCCDDENVIIPSLCQRHHSNLPSGRGYVFLSESGAVSAVVSGGSNEKGWKAWESAWQKRQRKHSSPPNDTIEDGAVSAKDLDKLFDGITCILMQREVPEYVNRLVATEARERGGIVVLQDIGGEEREISKEMMEACDYIIPNESELIRLALSLDSSVLKASAGTEEDKPSSERVVELAKLLQRYGARNVLVTRGARGSTLVSESGEVFHQAAFPLEASHVVDETGAGDCYRAAFAVALLEGHPPQRCMEFATAAGCCSVQKQGAVPSTPTRRMVEAWFNKIRSTDSVLNIPRGDGQSDSNKLEERSPRTLSAATNTRGGDAGFPFLIGSRLNSMKDRPELWGGGPLKSPRDFVKRQSQIEGLTAVDFNYPQHFGDGHWDSNEDARKALADAGLVAGAVCLRYPSKFARGAMNHPSASLREEAIALTKEAAQVALDLGCNEVVVWSAYDGYDYGFQVDYDEKWDQLIDAFRQCCDAFPQVKFSLEYKPTDENTRFFTVPSTGAALQLVDEIDRPNMGLTLDMGHCLMAGENPAQSIAMVGRKQKLFGVQLNDGYTRLAAEDGMMFGSIHPGMALEIMYQLRRTQFEGHFYFDTFPQRTDPIKEAECNIARVKAFWAAAAAISEAELKKATDNHDAILALEIVNRALRSL
ncbi:isomerase [Seminavis robusta]|uniref:Isomerase n=1 Tax=Seminavis robusta TaxID=568900 RepID=A0A9N8EN83_9STRA|nr:isomerase [Seminavis robusta]|eukprot:Sro1509_g278530.1 isomerase (748) ;mRNA; r:12151-14540